MSQTYELVRLGDEADREMEVMIMSPSHSSLYGYSSPEPFQVH
jgi:hypothetical protein